MRRLSFAAGILIAAAFGAAECMAAGNVLLPSGSGSSSGASLGLGGGSASAPAAPASVAAPVTPPPAPVASPAPAASAAPFGDASPMPALPAAAQQQAIITPAYPNSSVKLPVGSIPTQIIHAPNYASVLAQANANLPYGMTIGIDGKSVFGAKDVGTLNERLGLAREDIPTHCVLTVRGIVQTDKGTYILGGEATPQVSFRYDGMIKDYLMTATALCTAEHLPPGSGYLTETDGRFSVSLQPIECPAPNRQVSTLDVVYDGSGKSQCLYQ